MLRTRIRDLYRLHLVYPRAYRRPPFEFPRTAYHLQRLSHNSTSATKIVRPESYHLMFIDDIPNLDMFLGAHASISLQPDINQRI